MPKTGGTESILGGACTTMDMFRRGMRRMRRPMMRAPIVSYKHQRNEDTTYAGGGITNQMNVYEGVEPGAQGTPANVPAGNKVYSVNISLNFIVPSGSGTDTPSWFLAHLRQGQTISILFPGLSATQWTNIGLSKARNQVLKSYMSLIGTEDSGPIRYNVHIKIPKMYQRVREGDILAIVFSAQTVGPLSIGVRYKSFS